MSLFGSLQIGSNSLRAFQVGLQVVGNNIANANTPGYIREEVLYSPAPVQKIGGLTLGLGVEIDGIVQKVDEFLNERLRNAGSDRASAETQSKAYQDLETLIGELTDTDLSTGLTSFFGSIDEVAKNPAELSFRNLAIGRGQVLTSDFRTLASRAERLKIEANDGIQRLASEVNQLTERVRVLNLRITQAEGGGASGSQAGGLRTERNNVLSRLSEIVDVTVSPQSSGAVNVSVAGEFLIFEGQRRDIEAVRGDVTDEASTVLRFTDNAAVLNSSGGELNGLIAARDDILGKFTEDLDNLAGTLAFEFNKVFSQGQGLSGFNSLVSKETVTSSEVPLDEAGLGFTPVNGSFDLVVFNRGDASATSTHTISIDLNGLDGDSTLESVAAQLDAVTGITAEVTSLNRLSIQADSADSEFAFSGDTSGFLASIGLNTFFTGDTALSLNVNSELDGIQNAGRFAASLAGVGIEGDAENALRLANFFDRELEAKDGVTLAQEYDQLINGITQGATIADSVAEGFRLFEGTLIGEQQALSGVSIDEEAINMIQLQRSFQASARFIQTVSEMLDVLVNL